MQIQGSKASGALNNNTSKPETVVKKSEDRAYGQRTLSNNVKITNTSKPATKRVDSFGKSSFVTYSENLKKQSKTYNAASENAADGAAMVRTATDALKETQALLRRMEEISTQAEGDRLSTHDREVLQQEINSLTNTIDDISSTTSYDGINLFDGDGVTKVYKTTASLIPGQTSIVETSIPSKFDNKGNSFYKYGSTEALSNTDAKKELQNGNSLYLNAAMEQSAYTPASTPTTPSESTPAGRPELTENGARYTIELNSTNVRFNQISVSINNGSAKSVKNEDIGITKGTTVDINTLVEKLNSTDNALIKNNFVFNVGSNGTSLEITTFDSDKAKMTGIKFGTEVMEFTTTTTATENSGTPSTPEPLPDLYEYKGTEKLDAATAASKLANGETLYTNAFVDQTKAEDKKDYDYTPGKKIISEYTTPDEEEYDEIETAGLSYKTLNYQINGDGSSKFASVRIERMDSDAIGVNNLDISSQKRAQKSTRRIRSAIEQVANQQEYLTNAGSRLSEAATINNKNAGYVKTGQKIDAQNNPTTVEPKKDIYADLEQTILDNATKASEDAISILGTQSK